MLRDVNYLSNDIMGLDNVNIRLITVKHVT